MAGRGRILRKADCAKRSLCDKRTKIFCKFKNESDIVVRCPVYVVEAQNISARCHSPLSLQSACELLQQGTSALKYNDAVWCFEVLYFRCKMLFSLHVKMLNFFASMILFCSVPHQGFVLNMKNHQTFWCASCCIELWFELVVGTIHPVFLLKGSCPVSGDWGGPRVNTSEWGFRHNVPEGHLCRPGLEFWPCSPGEGQWGQPLPDLLPTPGLLGCILAWNSFRHPSFNNRVWAYYRSRPVILQQTGTAKTKWQEN